MINRNNTIENFSYGLANNVMDYLTWNGTRNIRTYEIEHLIYSFIKLYGLPLHDQETDSKATSNDEKERF